MKRRTRINYTPEQKAIIWDRYKQGDSLHDIARMFDRYHSSIMPTIHQTGGYRPPVRKRHRLALSLDEREEISRGLVAKLSIRDIAAKLSRAPSTISRGDSDCSLYALVDGLQYERHFGCEIKVEKGITYPLFDMYPDSKIAFAGPWLFRLNTSEFYRDALNELDIEYPAVSWLLSPLSIEDLMYKFKDSLNLELPDGKCALFRFYDPRVMEKLNVWLEESDCIGLVEGINKWIFTSHDTVVDLRAEVDSRRYG